MPAAWSFLDGAPEAAKAAVALLGAAGGGYIKDSLKATIERLRRKDGALSSRIPLEGGDRRRQS